MLARKHLLLSLALALCVACDVFPRFQLQLQKDLKREFGVTQAMVVIVDTTYMVVAVFDDARAALEPKARAGFVEQVAQYAVMHYQRTRLKSVGVIVGRATHRSTQDPEPTVFVPEYHPDGTVRLALMPRARKP